MELLALSAYVIIAIGLLVYIVRGVPIALEPMTILFVLVACALWPITLVLYLLDKE